MEITKLSSKGQVVIPEKVRAGLKEGTPFIITKIDGIIVLKEIHNISREEMKTLKGVKKAWNDLSAGRGKRQSKEELLRDLRKR